MFGRRAPKPAPARMDALGIGAQVVVVSNANDDDVWVGEPSGVIVSPGDNELVGFPINSLGGNTRWMVAFDEPQYLTDGRGPFDQATIASWRLVAAPPASD